MLYYWPIYKLKLGTIVAVEALIRWSHAAKGFVFPIEFISDCIKKSNDKDTLQYVINLAHHLRMTVVAIGIETKAQLELLKSLGCDDAQRYYLGRPVPAEKLIKAYKKREHLLIFYLYRTIKKRVHMLK